MNHCEVKLKLAAPFLLSKPKKKMRKRREEELTGTKNCFATMEKDENRTKGGE